MVTKGTRRALLATVAIAFLVLIAALCVRPRKRAQPEHSVDSSAQGKTKNALSAATETAFVDEKKPVARDPVPCPPLAALTAQVRVSLAVPPSTSPFSIVKCVPGFFPAPGFFVVAAVEDRLEQGAFAMDHGEHEDRVNLLARAVAQDATGAGIGRTETVDLDGDGTDEVLVDVSVDRRGIAQRTLYVYRRSDGKLDEALYLPLGFDNQGAMGDDGNGRDRFEARFRVGEPDANHVRALYVDESSHQGTVSPDWPMGHNEYRFEAGRMIRVTPTDASTTDSLVAPNPPNLH